LAGADKLDEVCWVDIGLHDELIRVRQRDPDGTVRTVKAWLIKGSASKELVEHA
jgi:hypothetical protein